METRRNNGNREIGERVRSFRRARGMSLKELAMRIPISDASISRLEKGESMVSVFTMLRIAGILGVSVADLLEGNERGGFLEEGSAAWSYTGCSREQKQRLLRIFAQITDLVGERERELITACCMEEDGQIANRLRGTRRRQITDQGGEARQEQVADQNEEVRRESAGNQGENDGQEGNSRLE